MQQIPSSALAEQQPASGQGLTTEEAELRLATIGPNEPDQVQRVGCRRQ